MKLVILAKDWDVNNGWLRELRAVLSCGQFQVTTFARNLRIYALGHGHMLPPSLFSVSSPADVPRFAGEYLIGGLCLCMFSFISLYVWIYSWTCGHILDPGYNYTVEYYQKILLYNIANPAKNC